MGSRTGRMSEVILKEEGRKFAKDGGVPLTGEIRLSDKGDEQPVEVHFRASNMKMLNAGRYAYRLMFLGLKNGKSLHRVLGQLEVHRDGTVSQSFYIDSDDVDGHGNDIRNFFIFMVVAVASVNRHEPYHPVLKGDWDGKWIDYGEAAHENGETEREEGTVHQHSTQKNYNGYYAVYVRDMVAALLAEKDQLRKLEPFEEKWLADNWRIEENACRFPLASVDAVSQIKKQGHFIFAFNDEYCLLGVPGVDSEEEKPDGGASGFNVWHQMRGSDVHGYWLTAIRRKTGEIVGV